MIKKSACMKPSAGFNGRLVERSVVGNIGAGGIALGEIAIGFYIDLLDATKAAKLAFNAVKIAVVVGIAAGETGLPPFISDRHFFDAMHWE